jgi:ParG protein
MFTSPWTKKALPRSLAARLCVLADISRLSCRINDPAAADSRHTLFSLPASVSPPHLLQQLKPPDHPIPATGAALTSTTLPASNPPPPGRPVAHRLNHHPILRITSPDKGVRMEARRPSGPGTERRQNGVDILTGRSQSRLRGEPVSPRTRPIEEVKRLNMNVPRDLHDAFKAATAAEGKQMTDVLMDYIRSYVERRPPAKPRPRGGNRK